MSCTANDKTRIEVLTGEDASYTFLVRDANGTLVDLTDLPIYFTARARLGDIAPLVYKRSTAAGGSDSEIYIPDQQFRRGQYVVQIDSEDTESIEPSIEAPYPYDSWVIRPTGKKVPVVRRGEFVVEESVTVFP